MQGAGVQSDRCPLQSRARRTHRHRCLAALTARPVALLALAAALRFCRCRERPPLPPLAVAAGFLPKRCLLCTRSGVLGPPGGCLCNYPHMESTRSSIAAASLITVAERFMWGSLRIR